MRLIRDDVDRTRALVDKAQRVLTEEEATRIARYVSALRPVAKDRELSLRKRFAGKTMEELLEMAREIPELHDALRDEEDDHA